MAVTLSTGHKITLENAPLNLAKNGTREMIAAPGASKQVWIYILGGTLGAGDGSTTVQDGDGNLMTGVMSFLQESGFCFSAFSLEGPIFKAATNTAVNMVLPANSDFDGMVQYAIVTV